MECRGLSKGFLRMGLGHRLTIGGHRHQTMLDGKYIHDGYYEANLYQVEPDETSQGLWRVGLGDQTGTV